MGVIQSGNVFRILYPTGMYDTLPVGVYSLHHSDRDGFYLEQEQDFTLPPKMYGDLSFIDRWIKSYEARPNKNLGIMLTGLKGSGKSVICRKFCLDLNKPVILINEPFTGVDFVSFITSPSLGDCIIFLDEFEKVYEKGSDSNTYLSLLDGIYNTHNVFLFTMNGKCQNNFLMNRPSRILYGKHYSSLEDSVITEVIDDLLVDKSPENVESIMKVLDRLSEVSYDILLSLISEMNLHQEDAVACVKHMNMQAESVYMTCEQVMPDGTVHRNRYLSEEWLDFGDATQKVCTEIYTGLYEDDEEEEKGVEGRAIERYITVSVLDFTKINRTTYVYELGEKAGKIIVKKKEFGKRDLVF